MRTSLPSKIHLPDQIRRKVIDVLAPLVADAIDLRQQAKQAHWNVRGPGFIALHKLFDHVVEAIDEGTDELAERIGQLGGLVAGTVQAAAEHSSLPEYPPEITATGEHVEALSSALASFGGRVREAINTTADLGDQATSDICTQVCREVDKATWKVESHMPQGRHEDESGTLDNAVRTRSARRGHARAAH